MAQIARLSDKVICKCCSPDCCPCPDGVIITASDNTYIEGIPVARVGDLASNCCGCGCPCPNTIVTGQPQTFVNGRNMAVAYSIVTCGVIVPSTKFTFTT